MKVLANAKINIGLAVGKKRDDGFHPISSYFARVSLCDSLDINIKRSQEFKCTIHSNVDYLSSGEDIMEKAARAFSRCTGIPFDINIDIEKNIPTKAGFGGGSSDGAAVLRYLYTFFNSPISIQELFSIALDVGSDVPFFLTGLPFAYVTGRGEIIKPVEVPSFLSCALLFMPDEEVSTGGAYALLDSLDYPFISLEDRLYPNLDKTRLPNDFERVVKSPLLGRLEKIYRDSAFVSLSGSGAGCYVLFDDRSIDQMIKLAPDGYKLCFIA